MKRNILNFFAATTLALMYSANALAADSLRSLPSGTKLSSSVDYSILANSICLVLTATHYEYGFDTDECTALMSQEKESTCGVIYYASSQERKLSGFDISNLVSARNFLDGNFEQDPSVASFQGRSSSGKAAVFLSCRAAGGKKQMTFDEFKKVLSPYFSITLPTPTEF